MKHKTLFVIGLLFFGLFFASRTVLDTLEQPAKGELATAQLEDDYTGYVVATRLYGWFYTGTWILVLPIAFWGYREVKGILEGDLTK